MPRSGCRAADGVSSAADELSQRVMSGGKYRVARRNPDLCGFLGRAGTMSMNRPRLLVCALLAVACAGTPASARIKVPGLTRSHVSARAMQLGDWKLKIVTGRFSHDVVCHLADPKHHVAYAAGALGFHFRHHVNTLGAWLRVDGGPAQRWQDNLPELTRLGVPMDGPSLDNPTNSTVWVPATLLTDANRIAIQPRENKDARVFHLRGFAGLRDIARDMGCVPEGRFVP
jgi:hypothetical protein